MADDQWITGVITTLESGVKYPMDPMTETENGCMEPKCLAVLEVKLYTPLII